jgi:hypothetical protein
MDDQLKVHIARCATARAHLAGAEAAELTRQAEAARRRYWREVATAQALTIGSLPAAEQLGAEP